MLRSLDILSGNGTSGPHRLLSIGWPLSTTKEAPKSDKVMVSDVACQRESTRQKIPLANDQWCCYRFSSMTPDHLLKRLTLFPVQISAIS